MIKGTCDMSGYWTTMVTTLSMVGDDEPEASCYRHGHREKESVASSCGQAGWGWGSSDLGSVRKSFRVPDELFSLSSPAFIFRGDNQRCHSFRVASRWERKCQN